MRTTKWLSMMLAVVLPLLGVVLVLHLFSGFAAFAALQLPTTGTIIIEKQTVPDGAAGSFTFTDTIASPNTFTLSDNGKKTFSDVPIGIYSVTEDDPMPGFFLTGLTCEDADSVGNPLIRTALITLGQGETITCTFTNSEWGTIVLHKETDPPNGASFSFATNIFGGGSFSLAAGATVSFTIPAATYTVTETLPFGWSLSNLNCESDVEGDTSSLSGNKVTIDLDPGETITCTLTNSEWGTIVLEKQTDPPNGASFSFATNIFGGGSFSLAAGATVSFTIPAATYTVTETLPFGWSLSNLNCESDVEGDTSSLSGNKVTIDLDPGETITCTLTNSEWGTIVLHKVTDPPGDVFDFLSDFGILRPPEFPLGPGFPLADGETVTFTIPAATYTVTETLPIDWELRYFACETDGPNDTFSQDENVVTIHVDAGETISCTFNNSQFGAIVIKKETDPAGDEKFDFTSIIPSVPGWDSFTLDPVDMVTIPLVPAGTYTVTEAAPPIPLGFDLIKVGCVEDGTNNSTTDLVNRQATIKLEAGETITCTFTNGQRGHIIVDKVTNPSGDPQSFNFTLTGGPSTLNQSFSLTDAAAPYDSDLILPGSGYSVAETVPGGWVLTGATCTDGSPVADIALSPGETVTCVFTNTRRGTIVVEKQTDPDGAPGTFTFAGHAAGTIPDDGQIVVVNLAPGTYTTTEDDPAPAFGLTSITCDDGGSATPSTSDLGTRTATFQLDPGETVKCTFTNALLLAPPSGESTDSVGFGQDTYTTSEAVFATGSGFVPNTYVDVYIVGDLAWADGMAIPPDVSSDGVDTVLTDAVGNLGPALVWLPPLTPGQYDLVFDANQNGLYDAAIDVVDDPNHPGFVVEEPLPIGGIVVAVNKVKLLAPWLGLAGLASLAALTVALVRRRKTTAR